MRKNRRRFQDDSLSILALDDDPIMTATLQSYFQGVGYRVDAENDPNIAIERVRNGNYDILLLDFLMTPICGDRVVEQIRKFNRKIFIILLTGHKSLAPPIKTIRELDIQGYYDKSERFDQLELLIESCVKSIRQLRTIRSYQEDTEALIELMPQVYRLESADAIGENILNAAAELMGCSNGYLLLNLQKDGGQGVKKYSIGSGIKESEILTFGELVSRLSGGEKSEGSVLRELLYDEQGNAVGVLAAELKNTPTLHQVQLFKLFARQSSAALGNTLLLAQVRNSYLEMTQIIRIMVDAKDIYTRGHSDRVAYYAQKLAAAIGRDEKYCERVRTAGLFHDMGKIGVPDEILASDRKLSEEEYELIKNHPLKSYEILSVTSHFKDIAPIVKEHHERIDGKGYPEQLAGNEILEEARILAIADAFDAMTSQRRYRGALTLEEAISQLEENKGTQFDPELVDAFIKVLSDWGKITEELSNCEEL